MLSIAQLYELYLSHPVISTDSRKISEGCLFFALKGERFNGNLYAMQALEKGAAFAVVDEKEHAQDERCLLVEDVLVSLQDLARHHRRQLSTPVIAITGSNGKTTTKELCAAVLSQQYRTHFTQGNFNNHIGVPLTLLAMPLNTEIAIIEMGANHQGEIAALCEIAEPTHGLITNIGLAHLEGFGGPEGVKKGKTELYRFLARHGGTVFVNLDEKHLKDSAKAIPHQVDYCQSEAPDYQHLPFEFQLLASSPFLKIGFMYNKGNSWMEVESQLVGQYNFGNITTAMTLGRYFKVPPDKIRKAVENYVPQNNRSQIITRGTNTFLLDAYNANPTSMKRALDNLAQMEGQYRMAILGDMLELGTYQDQKHREMLTHAQELQIDQIVVVGPAFGEVAGDGVLHFDQVDQVRPWLESQELENYLVLIKGSRGIQLERLLSEEKSH